jgi:predicted site-specific integrase-resolvase
MKNDQGLVFIVVYYRDIPMILKSTVNRDGKMKMVKDGIHDSIGHSCPRLTVTMEPVSDHQDKDRLKSVVSLLEELESNNQIVSFAVKR